MEIVFLLDQKPLLIHLLHISHRETGVRLHRRSETIVHPKEGAKVLEGAKGSVDLKERFSLVKRFIVNLDGGLENRNAEPGGRIMENLSESG
jgi:hypothetical protein